MDALGLRTARRANVLVTYHTYLASGGRLLYTMSVELVGHWTIRKWNFAFRSEVFGLF